MDFQNKLATHKMDNTNNKYWVLTAEMGYGHQRATYPFAGLAHRRVINMNNDDFVPKAEKRFWKNVLWGYEFLSRAKKYPLIGKTLFLLLDLMLKIPEPEEKTDFQKPTIQVKLLKMQINRGLCRGVIGRIVQNPLPLITSFYAPAIAADKAGLNDIFCIICDSDLNRVWVSENPAVSNIKYFAPCRQAAERLRMFGVPSKNIILSGFPLHPELLGDRSLLPALKRLCLRLQRLNYDYSGSFTEQDISKYAPANHGKSANPLTISFAVGGAGAQTEIADDLLFVLKALIKKGEIKMNLLAGTKTGVLNHFKKLVADTFNEKQVKILFEPNKYNYFKSFNRAMLTTDILITKPSEVSFYAGLGIPILMTPPIGSQEEYNRKWLIKMQAAVDLPPKTELAQWFIEKLNSGYFANLALNGWGNIEKGGFFNIIDYLDSLNFRNKHE